MKVFIFTKDEYGREDAWIFNSAEEVHIEGPIALDIQQDISKSYVIKENTKIDN